MPIDASDSIRLDHRLILDLVDEGATVLDLGCGDGELMALLVREKKVKAQGIEIDEQAIYACVAKGLNVVHWDLDSGLADYADDSFDYVILNQSLQQVRRLADVLMDSLRVGRRVIIGFPNFAHCRARFQMFFRGTTPTTAALPYPWYDSPNLHFFSIKEFVAFCRERGIRIEWSAGLGKRRVVPFLPNLFAEIGLFLLSCPTP